MNKQQPQQGTIQTCTHQLQSHSQQLSLIILVNPSILIPSNPQVIVSGRGDIQLVATHSHCCCLLLTQCKRLTHKNPNIIP